MKKMFFACCCAAALLACNNEKKEGGDEAAQAAATTAATDLPYTAMYTTNWTDNVSDADLKTVLQSYKDWETGNMDGLAAAMADTADIDMSDGTHLRLSNADLKAKWTGYRDSLSSVSIKMDTWKKMYSPKDSNSFIIVWYDEYDTYKNGKVDSASYHDINGIKDGKIIWFSQYKRPKK
jgi:hypothetical protein